MSATLHPPLARRSRSFRAMGTFWWVCCDLPELLEQAEQVVHDDEAQLSRFRPDSALSALNQRRALQHPRLAAVVRSALRMFDLTGGAFDPRLGAQLAALGYDRSFENLAERIATHGDGSTLDIQLEGDAIQLHGRGDVDLGGIAKGFVVDRVIEHLCSQGASEVVVDGGGDLRSVGVSWLIGVGEGLEVWSNVGAVATSSTRERRWRSADGVEHHHVLDPSTSRSVDSSLCEATIIAPDTTMADALATAALVAPDRVLLMLENLNAHALVRSVDGTWWTTPGFPFARPAGEPMGENDE